MKFMLIVKATKESEKGGMPDAEMIEKMGKFNQEMMDAGIWVDATGLKASSQGARVNFSSSDKRSTVHGPFAETSELIAGFWTIKVDSLEEAISWAERSPHPHPGYDTNIEIRQLWEMEEFA